MAPAQIALLADRGVVRVAGADADKLLQGIITNDMDLLAKQHAIHAGLLTPQGKILFDFFVVKAPDGFLLDIAREKTAEFIKRLQMYRLRAKVEITDESSTYRVYAQWGSAAGTTDGIVTFPDPRLSELGWRILAETTIATADAGTTAYHAHRIALGVPEGGKDYAFGDAFPHEADFDALGGVSFDKGCFVGQEVVSRMQHRGGARKRIVPVEGDAPLTSGAHVEAGSAVIGTICSVAGRQALAMIRLDRAAEAEAKGEPLRARGIPITLPLPPWTKAGSVGEATTEAT